MGRWRLTIGVLLLAASCGGSGDVRAAPGGGGGEGRPQAPAAPAGARAEALLARLRDYVYATYELEGGRTEPALERLRAAREALARAMTEAGLGGGGTGGGDGGEAEAGLAAFVGDLRGYFQKHGDLIFVPLGEDAAGVLLVRVVERRESNERSFHSGKRAAYKLVAFGEVAIEDLESWRRRAAGLPPSRPAARLHGKTIFIDRGIAARLAREVVIPRAAAAPGLEARAKAGERLPAADEKDLLRHRALAAAIGAGEPAVARAIEREEEMRLAAYLAHAPADLAAPGAAARAAERATMAALASPEPDPRYHLASAIAMTLAAPGTPPAEGAARALGAFGERPLDAYAVEEIRARARAVIEAWR